MPFELKLIRGAKSNGECNTSGNIVSATNVTNYFKLKSDALKCPMDGMPICGIEIARERIAIADHANDDPNRRNDIQRLFNARGQAAAPVCRHYAREVPTLA